VSCDVGDCSGGDGRSQGVASAWEDMVSSMLASPPGKPSETDSRMRRMDNLDIHGASEQYI